MRVLSAILLVCLLARGAFAQKETHQWFLNNNRISISPSGVSNLVPTGTSAGFNPAYGSTSVSDAAGSLLFACDGQKIIDRNLSLMPAVKDVSFNSRSKVLAVAIPHSSRYYVFYSTGDVWNANGAWSLKYAVVDLSLNGGLGDVVSYDQPVASGLSQGFTLVQGEDTEDAWLVTHRLATDSFLVYPITQNGLGTVPVISKAGSNVTTIDYQFYDLKTSPNGKMIGGIADRVYPGLFAEGYQFLEVFQFDAATGKLSSKVRTLRGNSYYYSGQTVEFSPDNRLVYGCYLERVYGLQPCGWGGGSVVQYNLCYTDSVEFTRYSMQVASVFTWCGPDHSWGRIQMGADKRIYMPYTGGVLSRLNNPNRIGTFVNYAFNGYQLPNNNYLAVATPTYHHRLLQKAVKNNIVYDGGCFPAPLSFRITNDAVGAVEWDFGDPGSAANRATELRPQHVFSAPGLYTITARLYDATGAPEETLTELVEIKDPAQRLLHAYPKDTIFCQGGELKLKLSVVNGLFNWYGKQSNGERSRGITSDSFTINYSATIYVEMRQNDCNGCIMTDSIKVTVLPVPYTDLGPSRSLCTGDSLQLKFWDQQADYLWSTGDTTAALWVKDGGTYWVRSEYNHNGCPVSDTLVVTRLPGVEFALPGDTTLCSGQSLLLNPGVAAASYLWQNGTTQPTQLVSSAGTYWVRATLGNGCRRSDTLRVAYIDAQGVDLGRDTTLCRGDSLELRVSVAGARYRWSTGATTASVTVKEPGTYWVEANNGHCTVTDTVRVAFTAPPTVALGRDTALCPQERLVLRAAVAGAHYLWQDGSAADTLLVAAAGTYWLQVQKDGCRASDTLLVRYHPSRPLLLGRDTAFCQGQQVVLDAGPGFAAYAWSTGAATRQITAGAQGTYSVTGLTAEGCPSRDTLVVTAVYPNPVVSLGSDATLCSGAERVLDAGAFERYRWQDGSSARTLVIRQPGTYTVTVQDAHGCNGSGALVVNQLLPLPRDFLPADTAICAYGTVVLRPEGRFTRYVWSNGATTPTLTIDKPGLYRLAATDDNGCVGLDEVVVNPKDCLEGLYVPNAFTPNGDGRNDVLRARLFGLVKHYRFSVYNRYGEVVFQTTDPSKGWDGGYKGKPQDTNVFVWVCRYQLEGAEVKTEKGTVVVIR